MTSKLKIALIIGTASVVIGALSGLYFGLQHNKVLKLKDTNVLHNKTSLQEETNSVFPTLQSDVFNEFIKQDEFGTKSIDQTVVLAIVKFITTRLKSVAGQLEFDYAEKQNELGETYLELYFNYSEANYHEAKSYKVFLV